MPRKPPESPVQSLATKWSQHKIQKEEILFKNLQYR
ncbi:unnamed protein product [Tenebrio molitor]|nr:unnamed protein product [Tenebrio molitor]